KPPCQRTKLLLHLVELAQGDAQQPIGRKGDSLVQTKLLFDLVAPQAERRFCTRREIALEILDVGLDGRRSLRRGISEIAENVQVVQRDERPRQIDIDELEDATPAFKARLDED